jgi:hypothetical protein
VATTKGVNMNLTLNDVLLAAIFVLLLVVAVSDSITF